MRAEAYLHPLRRKILDWLKARGPATQTEVARAVDTAPASARFHLLVLKRAGFVKAAGTRPGPKGITEKLFHVSKGGKAMRFSTRHGTPQDRQMRKLALDEHAEAHRAGSRVILRDPARWYGLSDYDLAGSREELHRLDLALRRTVERFARRARRGKGERCKVQLGFYPLPASA